MKRNQLIQYREPCVKNKEAAVNTVISVVLMLFLVIALAGIAISILSGHITATEKTAYVVVEANITSIDSGIEIIEIKNLGGDIMNYEGLSKDSLYEVRFMVDSDNNPLEVKNYPELLTNETWSPGDTVYIFRRADGYYLTNKKSLIIEPINLPSGTISVSVIDNTHNQLVAHKIAGDANGNGEPTTTATTTPATTTTTSPPTTEPTSSPGFGALLTLTGLSAAALFAIRRNY